MKNEWIKGTESIHFCGNFAEISHILWLNLSNFYGWNSVILWLNCSNFSGWNSVIFHALYLLKFMSFWFISALTQSEIAKAQKFVAEHLKRGMIRELWSPYATNFFFVKKKDRKLRPVQDYRPINKWTKRNHNVSPLIPQTINHLSGCMLFTKFDIWWGYNNICIKPGDEPKAAFLTPEGLFEPMVMFFGLTNSPATFQMMMNTIFCKQVAQG